MNWYISIKLLALFIF